jgi:putative hydrolase of the HAD superfamily
VTQVPVAGVLVDLDDTLFPQAAWLAGAWKDVAAAAPLCIDASAFEVALIAVASEGTDRGRIINRALDALPAQDVEDVDVTALVAAFRAHRPARLECYPGARAALCALRSCGPVALVTDGDPHNQWGKIEALGLRDAFDAIVVSDEMGREFRKPHAAPFAAALERIGVHARNAVMIGDRPAKDVAGARAAGMLGAVRVRTGEYRSAPGDDALATVDDFATAAAWLQSAGAREERDPTPTATPTATAEAEGHRDERGHQERDARATVAR